MADAAAETSVGEQGLPAGAVAATIVDAYPDAERYIDAGLNALGLAVKDVVKAQVEASAAELATMNKVLSLAEGQYAEVQDNVSDVAAFYKQLDGRLTALAPFLAQVDELDGVVAQLEEAARVLDGQSRQLEVTVAELLPA